jgi:hypothetical protein
MSNAYYRYLGRNIQPTFNSHLGRWKIKVQPGRIEFFKCVAEAKEWCDKNPINLEQTSMQIITEA